MAFSWRRRIKAILAAGLLIFMTSAAPGVKAAEKVDNYLEQLDKLSDQLINLQKQQKTIKEQIAGAQTQKEKRLAEKLHWESQIELTQKEIAVLSERIEILQEQVDSKTEEIAFKQAEIDYQFDLYKKRLRANYMAGQSSKWSMLFGAEDITDFLMRGEVVRATAEHDEALAETLKEDRENLLMDKADLDKSKRAVESDEARMQEKKQELESALNTTRSAIQDIDQMEREYRSRAVELGEMDKKLQAEMDAIYEKIDNSGEFVGGLFQWPLPGYTSITSYYGNRFNNTNFHTGIDISGVDVYGKSIIASNSGTVALVNTAYKEGVGYGKYVIVNHGGGYTSLYGHMSSISVSEGDSVTRGVTEIGKVGSTGWSTGPHVHFEIRVDGKHQNPLGFLKAKG